MSFSTTGDPPNPIIADSTNNYYQVINDSYIGANKMKATYKTYSTPFCNTEESKEDIFKQVTSLLGLKIVNVFIKDGRLELICRRNKALFKISITGDEVIVERVNGKAVVQIPLFKKQGYDYEGLYPLDWGTTTPNTAIDTKWEYYTTSNAVR